MGPRAKFGRQFSRSHFGPGHAQSGKNNTGRLRCKATFDGSDSDCLLFDGVRGSSGGAVAGNVAGRDALEASPEAAAAYPQLAAALGPVRRAPQVELAGELARQAQRLALSDDGGGVSARVFEQKLARQVLGLVLSDG